MTEFSSNNSYKVSKREIFHNLVKCAICLSEKFEEIYKFGNVPLAGYFPISGQEDSGNSLPMDLYRCKNCSLVQISPIVYDDFLFSDYRYRSNFSMKSHFEELAEWLIRKGFKSEDKILEIGSNDGTLIEALRVRGLDCVGVDPATNIIEYSRNLGHKVINEKFSNQLVEFNNLASDLDLIIACNSFAHIENVREVCLAIGKALKVGGSFVVEVQSWEKLVERRAFDFVYHEHKYYYDLQSLSYLLALGGMKLQSAEIVESHGGSWRCNFVKVNPGSFGVEDLNQSKTSMSIDYIQDYIFNFFRSLEVVNERVLEVHRLSQGVVGFGASGRANMLLSYMSLQNALIAVFDESPERIGRNMGFSGIPIKSFRSLDRDEYTTCVVLAWNFFEAIAKKWPHKDKTLIMPLPELKFLQT